MVRLPPRVRPLYPFLKPLYTYATRLVAPASQWLSRHRGSYLPTGFVQSLDEAAALTGGRCVTVRPQETITRVPPACAAPGERTFHENRVETVPRVVVAELPRGRVLGPHSAVISGAGDLVQDVSYYFGTSKPREHPLFLHPFPGPPLDVAGRLGVLATRGDVNYYHFLMDVLPRLQVMADCPEIPAPDRWYVPARSRFQTELLELFGIAADVRIDSTEHRHVRAECLVVPAPPSMTVINPPWVVSYLRSRLLAEPIERVPGRAIYVTRGGGANNRQVTNEAALLALLGERGFEVIDPGQMSVAGQVRSFAEASVVVAPHGAALANLVFASPGATVIELFPAGCVLPDFWKLANGVAGLDYRYLSGRGVAAANSRAKLLVTDIEVDLPALSEMLHEVDTGDRRGGRTN